MNNNTESKDLQSNSEDNVGYFHNKEGSLYYRSDGKAPTLISESYIKNVALVRTQEKRGWSNRIEFKDMDGEIQFIDIPSENLVEIKETRKTLIRAGFDQSCTPKVIKYLISATQKKRFTLINRTGWINDNEYICPSFTVHKSDGYFLDDNMNSCGFAQKGSLKDWKENICKHCDGNNNLTFALCIGLASTLLKFFPTVGTTIVNFVGKSSTGKTTALKVAASLWGESKFKRQWRATSNGHEGAAEHYKDGSEFSNHLSTVSAEHYGMAAEEFITELTNDDPNKIKDMFDNNKFAISERFQLKDADGEVMRVAEIFALILTAGILACADKYCVLTHNTESVKSAIYAVFERWLEDRGGKKHRGDNKIMQYLDDFLIQNASRFKKIVTKTREDTSEYDIHEDRIINNCLGYINHSNGASTYYTISRN